MAAEAVFAGTSSAWGNKRVALGTITLSGLASGACYIPGINYIEGAVASLNSQTSNTTYTLKYNTGSGATAIEGMFDICSAVAGDVFGVIIWGR